MASFRKESCFAVFILVMSLLGPLAYAVTQSKGYPKPPNCFTLECAPYDVIDSRRDFEIRSYENALWISNPPINSSSYKQGSDEGFNILFAYIYGKNKKAQKIPMSAPVLVDITPLSGKSTYVTYFYVPKKFEKKVPQADNVIPVTLPKHKYAAVRRFGGFLSENNIPIEAAALKKSLKGTPYESAIGGLYYTVAGYNSPFELVFRVNEVLIWFDKI